jgi:threonyl-tRNA synthetase
VIHRAILGSFERFIAVLIEHTAGAFPFWLAPVQVVVLPIAERHHEYGQRVTEAHGAPEPQELLGRHVLREEQRRRIARQV